MEQDGMPEDTHFHCSKVVIGELQVEVTDSLREPYVPCRVITVNGEIWTSNFMPFGLCEDVVRNDWDKRDLKTWTRIHPPVT
jgi:hypothetical protein